MNLTWPVSCERDRACVQRNWRAFMTQEKQHKDLSDVLHRCREAAICAGRPACSANHDESSRESRIRVLSTGYG
jgi:hypothetical protein